MAPLDTPLKRALNINGRDYVITLTPDALKITQKGHRLGIELKWPDLVSGESALAVALQASIGKFHDLQSVVPRHAKAKTTASIAGRRVTGKRNAPRRLR